MPVDEEDEGFGGGWWLEVGGDPKPPTCRLLVEGSGWIFRRQVVGLVFQPQPLCHFYRQTATDFAVVFFESFAQIVQQKGQVQNEFVFN